MREVPAYQIWCNFLSQGSRIILKRYYVALSTFRQATFKQTLNVIFSLVLPWIKHFPNWKKIQGLDTLINYNWCTLGLNPLNLACKHSTWCTILLLWNILSNDDHLIIFMIIYSFIAHFMNQCSPSRNINITLATKSTL